MLELNGQTRERCILVGVSGVVSDRWQTEDHLEELALLADTAGADTVDTVIQDRSKFDPAYYIGRGKADFLKRLVDQHDAKLIIFDDDLTPAQARNLEKLLGQKVLDRSGLILDIFARRAKTKESRTQVELAQLRYLLPRLTRAWTHLSRQVGGIGTRGPGETQLEVDRRLIRKRITNLERDLEKISKQREMRRKHRDGMFKAALVGYTNVGKSTLMNSLTTSEVLAENRLFATLDATVRELEIERNTRILLIDTVGFIRKLPHHLVASFKSTLEEARDADLLVHVVDLTNSQFEEQMQTVQSVLADLELTETPVLFVFNKVDALDNHALISAMKEKHVPSVFISAARRLFLDDFKAALLEQMRERDQLLEFHVQAGDGEALARIHALARVKEQIYNDDEVIVQAQASPANASKLIAFASARGLTIAQHAE